MPPPGQRSFAIKTYPWDDSSCLPASALVEEADFAEGSGACKRAVKQGESWCALTWPIAGMVQVRGLRYQMARDALRFRCHCAAPAVERAKGEQSRAMKHLAASSML